MPALKRCCAKRWRRDSYNPSAKIDVADIGQHISELHHAVTAASLNYDVWRVFENVENREKYTDVMILYYWLFSSGIDAHFVALLILLYQVYENKVDTHNIPKLLDFLRYGEHLPHAVMAELDGLRTQAVPPG